MNWQLFNNAAPFFFGDKRIGTLYQKEQGGTFVFVPTEENTPLSDELQKEVFVILGILNKKEIKDI